MVYTFLAQAKLWSMVNHGQTGSPQKGIEGADSLTQEKVVKQQKRQDIEICQIQVHGDPNSSIAWIHTAGAGSTGKTRCYANGVVLLG